jgi:hypothetical protein
VGNSVLETLIETAQDVVDEVAVFDARAEIAEGVGHVLHLGGVLDDGEIALVEVVKLVTEVGGARVAIVVENAADGAPEGEGGGVARLYDRQSGRRDRAVVPRDDGEVVEHPVGGALGGGAVDVIPEPELGEGGAELTALEAVVLLLVIQRDEDVVTDVESLQLRGGESLSCDGDTELFEGIVIGVQGGGGVVADRAHGGEGEGVAAEAVEGIGSRYLIP